MSDFEVEIGALTSYRDNLGYYSDEADAFGRLIDRADVTNESWGLIGLAVKQTYTGKLSTLQELMAELKDGVETLTDKIDLAAKIYQGAEDDASVSFGGNEATFDGPR